MSLARAALRSRTAALRLTPTTTRPFHITAARAALSESDLGEQRASEFYMHLTSLYFPTYYICLITAKANITLGGQDTDDRKAKIDHHKDDQLAKQKDGKGHWKRELSSNSESAVKADRGEIKDAKHDIESLAKKTSEALQADHEHGKSK